MMFLLDSRNIVILTAVLYCTIVGLTSVSAFTPTSAKTPKIICATSNFPSSSHNFAFSLTSPAVNNKIRKFSLSSSLDDEDPNAEEDYKPPPSVGETVAPIETVSSGEEESSLPLDLPSPILLASSIVLAIAATGSTFQLAGGDAPNGFAITASIIAISLPSSAFLFYAAILKGQAETEADDREFRSKNKGRF